MVIPTRSECLMLMNRARMPLHIQKHSLMVAAISLYLGRRLNENSVRLNLKLVDAGALLHDIAKADGLSTGEGHDELGARMVERWGYPVLAPVVRNHVHLDETSLIGPITESLVVNYADKRVKHDQVVTLEERFHDLIDRYGRSEEHRVRLLQKLDLYVQFERKLFDHLTITPVEAELMQLSVDAPAENELEEYERHKAYGGTIGRREIG